MALKDAIAKALRRPLEIRRSQKDPSVHLYYGRHEDKLLYVVARHLNEEGFMVLVTLRVTGLGWLGC